LLTAPAGKVQESIGEKSSDKILYQGIFEWRKPVPEEFSKRELVYQHAVAYLDGVPQPAALCGYQYSQDDLPQPETAVIWGLGVSKRRRCPMCTIALRKAGYALWDINPRTLGGSPLL
jgi:hypothetical protein